MYDDAADAADDDEDDDDEEDDDDDDCHFHSRSCSFCSVDEPALYCSSLCQSYV